MRCSKCGDGIDTAKNSHVTRFDLIGGDEHFHVHCWETRRRAGAKEAPPGTQGVTKTYMPLKSNLLAMPLREERRRG